MENQLQIMPGALRLLAGEIKAPDDIPEMCLRDAAAMIESLVEQRDDARLQAEIERDKHCHPDHGGHLFSWENAKTEGSAEIAVPNPVKSND